LCQAQEPYKFLARPSSATAPAGASGGRSITLATIDIECMAQWSPPQAGCSAWLDRLQRLEPYITGPLLPNARSDYRPGEMVSDASKAIAKLQKAKPKNRC